MIKNILKYSLLITKKITKKKNIFCILYFVNYIVIILGINISFIFI